MCQVWRRSGGDLDRQWSGYLLRAAYEAEEVNLGSGTGAEKSMSQLAKDTGARLAGQKCCVPKRAKACFVVARRK